MSATYIGTSSVFNEKLYRAGLIHQAETQLIAMGFAGSDEDSGIVMCEDASRRRGDTIQIRFSPTDDTFDGFGDNDQIEGEEESLEMFYDSFKLDYLAIGYAQASQMTQQRVSVDLKKAAFTKLGVRWSRRFEQTIWNQLCGYTPAMGASQDNYKRTGHNPVTELDSDHLRYPTGISADENVTSGNGTPSLNIINELLERAMSLSHLDYPLLPCPDGYYHAVFHPRQWTLLRQNTSAGDWGDIQRAVLEGGKEYSSSSHARGFLGVYGNVKLHVSDWIPWGVNSGDPTLAVQTIRRVPFFGSRAGHMAFGQGYTGGMHLDWVEQVRNYKTWGVIADSVFGMKRCTWTDPSDDSTHDYGVIVAPMYSGG